MTTAVLSAGHFFQAKQALAFLGTAANIRPTPFARLQRAPDGWWIEVEDARQIMTPLIRMAGGRPFNAVLGGWAAADQGSLSIHSDPDLKPADWPIVDLALLLAASPLPLRKPEPVKELAIITLPALGRWVLRRSLVLGLQVELAPIARRPLDGKDVKVNAWLLTLRGKKLIPTALLRAIGDLPDTLMAEFHGMTEQLLIDVRCRCPLPETVIINEIPATEHWALGPSDVGHWRFQRMGAALDGVTFLQSSAVAVTPAANNAPAGLPAPMPVRLIRRRENRRQADALLLDETELKGLALLLATRPDAEAAFLLPGAGRYLLTAPGGLSEALPFGIPLVRIGPGGLYREQNRTFHPLLPAGARRHVFFTSGKQQIVAVVAEGTFGFELRHCVPAWTLWVGDTPPVQGGLTVQGEQILSRVAETIRAAAAQQAPFMSIEDSSNQDLLEQAQRAEWIGDWARAAELLESAGESVRAARLYERAAKQAGFPE